MVTLQLDEQQTFFLTELISNALKYHESDIIFTTTDENDELTYDAAMKEHIEEIEILLDKVRGF